MKTPPDRVAGKAGLNKSSYTKASPDNTGIEVENPGNVEVAAAEVNRDVRELAKKSLQQQKRNDQQHRREKDL